MKIGPSYLRSINKGTPPAWASLLDRAILGKPSDLVPAELRYLRLRAGWTASELSQALGVSSKVTVARWESGARRLPKPTERLFRVLAAEALGVRPLHSLMEKFKRPWHQAKAQLDVYLYPEKESFEYRWAIPPRSLPEAVHHLFWDTNPRQLDLKRHADYIITRVLEKGDLDDWNWLRWTFGEARIAALLNQRRRLDPATVRLWRNVILAQPEGR